MSKEPEKTPEEKRAALLQDAQVAIGLTQAMTKRTDNYTLSNWPLHSSTYIDELHKSYELFQNVIIGLLELVEREPQ